MLYWCTIGGTSVASPLIASTFALAGGASKVEYPAKTLYENEAKSPGSLHDVTTGSNGECTKPFSETGLSGCTSTEESKSCAAKAICLAGTGYDGPTGVGTPDGIAAFEPAPVSTKPTVSSVSPSSGSVSGGTRSRSPAPVSLLVRLWRSVRVVAPGRRRSRPPKWLWSLRLKLRPRLALPLKRVPGTCSSLTQVQPAPPTQVTTSPISLHKPPTGRSSRVTWLPDAEGSRLGCALLADPSFEEGVRRI